MPLLSRPLRVPRTHLQRAGSLGSGALGAHPNAKRPCDRPMGPRDKPEDDGVWVEKAPCPEKSERKTLNPSGRSGAGAHLAQVRLSRLAQRAVAQRNDDVKDLKRRLRACAPPPFSQGEAPRRFKAPAEEKSLAGNGRVSPPGVAKGREDWGRECRVGRRLRD